VPRRPTLLEPGEPVDREALADALDVPVEDIDRLRAMERIPVMEDERYSFEDVLTVLVMRVTGRLRDHGRIAPFDNTTELKGENRGIGIVLDGMVYSLQDVIEAALDRPESDRDVPYSDAEVHQALVALALA